MLTNHHMTKIVYIRTISLHKLAFEIKLGVNSNSNIRSKLILLVVFGPTRPMIQVMSKIMVKMMV